MKKKPFQIGEKVRIVGTRAMGKVGTVTGIVFHTDSLAGPHHFYRVASRATRDHLRCEPEELEHVADLPLVCGSTPSST